MVVDSEQKEVTELTEYETVTDKDESRDTSCHKMKGPSRSDWYDRIFREGFTPEDVVLYLLSFVMIASFVFIFQKSQEREKELIGSLSGQVIEQWAVGAEDDRDLTHMRAQVVVTAMLYHQGSVTTAALSTRLNLGFLVGTVITIIGCIIVIRGVRESAISADLSVPQKLQATFTTASPGVFIALLGAVILGITLYFANTRPYLQHSNIECYECISNHEKSGSAANDMTPTITPEPTPTDIPTS